MFTIDKIQLPDKTLAPRSGAPVVAIMRDVMETFENDFYRTFSVLPDTGFIEWEIHEPGQAARYRCHFSGVHVIVPVDDPFYAPLYDKDPELIELAAFPV